MLQFRRIFWGYRRNMAKTTAAKRAPSKPVKKGEPVTFVYQWGHPFEHQLFDATAPANLVVLTPDGKKSDLTRAMEKVSLVTAEKKEVAGYRLRSFG